MPFAVCRHEQKPLIGVDSAERRVDDARPQIVGRLGDIRERRAAPIPEGRNHLVAWPEARLGLERFRSLRLLRSIGNRFQDEFLFAFGSRTLLRGCGWPGYCLLVDVEQECFSKSKM